MTLFESDGRVLRLSDAVRLSGGVDAVARRCGLSRSALYRILEDQLLPRFENRRRLAHGLGVTIAEVELLVAAERLSRLGYRVVRDVADA